METTAGRGCHVDDRHVWAERAGGCERLIVGCQVGDHVESFGAQQGTAGGAGYLMIIDDHDPGRPAAAGGAISAGLHIATIAVRRHWPHRRYRQCQARPPWGRPSRISSAREVMPSLVLDELETADLVTLADKGYQGSTWAKVPYRGRNKPEPQKQANRAPRQTPRAGRAGERAAQSMEDPQQAPLLPLARRETRESHPRIETP
jgi:hypothetical protein